MISTDSKNGTFCALSLVTVNTSPTLINPDHDALCGSYIRITTLDVFVTVLLNVISKNAELIIVKYANFPYKDIYVIAAVLIDITGVTTISQNPGGVNEIGELTTIVS